METIPPRAPRSFSSVVYGDLAACVSHCLSFADLFAWSAVNRDGRAAVRYKFDHCGLINIADLQNISMQNFKNMCERLRGVQVVLLPTSHPCILGPDPEARGFASDEQQYSLKPGLPMLLDLMTANAAWLTAVTFIHPALPSTSSQSTCEMQICQTLTANLHLWPNCILIPRSYPIPLKASKQLIERNQEARKAAMDRARATGASGFDVAGSTASSTTAASCVSSPTQLSLSLNNGRMLLALSDLWPSLETLELSFDEQPEQADHLENNSLCFQQAINNLQSLLSVQLQLNGAFFPSGTVLSLHLPLVLQLMLIDHSDLPSGLGDLDLDCPRLVGLNLPVAFSGSSGRPLFAPPLMLATLAKSKRLRALALINLDEPAAVPNLSESLSPEQRAQLDARAAALGRSSLFADPVNPARVFVYWLSTLPFAGTLEMFEDFPTCVGIEEILALFPAIKGYGVTPPYCFYSEPWLRPTWVEDPLNFEQAPYWREQGLIRSWDRLASHPQESANEFSKRMSTNPPVPLPSSLSIAMPNTELTAAACARMLQSSAMFQSLRIVFLAAPCQVEVAAVRSLLLECAELHSLSLIQLDAIGDDLFTDLPAALTKPSLRTLRLKGRCDNGTEERGAFFTPQLMLRLASLFPKLQHLELLTSHTTPLPLLLQLLHVPSDPASGFVILDPAVISLIKLPHLRTLVIDPPTTMAQILHLERAWYERYECMCRIDPAAVSDAWRLQLVQLDQPMSEDVFEVSDDWPTHNRIVQRRESVPAGSAAFQRFVTRSVSTCMEACCVSMYCRLHHHEFADAIDPAEAEAEAQADPQQEEPEGGPQQQWESPFIPTSTMSAAAASAAINSHASTAYKPTFSSVVYGDVAACVSHCLSFADLFAWSAVNRDGRAAVRYKFDHCGLINIADLQNISMQNFKNIYLERDHVDLSVPSDPVIWRAQAGVELLLSLMASNVSSLVAVSFVPTFLRPTAGEYASAGDSMCEVLFEHAMRRDSRLQIMPFVYTMEQATSKRVVQRALEYATGAQEMAQPPPLHAEHRYHKDGPQPKVSRSPAAQKGAPHPSQIRQLSLLLPFRSLPLLATAFPRLEILRWGAVPHRMASAREDLKHNFACLSSSMLNIGGSLLNLYLDLDGNCVPRGSTLTLQLPVALQVMVTDCSIPTGLSDLQLDCPSLTALNLALVFLRTDADGEWMDDEESYARVPPLVLASLAKMPHLRGLCLFDLDKPASVDAQRLVDRLSPQEKEQINAKTNSLHRPSLFADGVELDHARLLLYSLSVMPFGPTLQSFEEWPADIRMEEMMVLFPRLAGITSSPPYSFFVPRWLRPEPRLDPLSLPFVTYWRQQRVFRSWDRLHAQSAEESVEEFAARLSSRSPVEIPAWLTLALPNTRLDADECARLLQASTMFQSLRIVYLSSPVEVQSAAVRSLLLGCAGLQSLSLIQLVGVGDEVFLDLPSHFRRPSLETLRIKSPCSQAIGHALLARIGAQFPNLSHLEMLMSAALWKAHDDQFGRELIRLLNSVHFLPRLWTLVVTHTEGKGPGLRAHWMRRWECAAAVSPPLMSVSSLPPDALPTLHLVTIGAPCTDDSYRGQWHGHGRVGMSSAVVESRAFGVRTRCLESVESSCLSAQCCVADHRAFVDPADDVSSSDSGGEFESDDDQEAELDEEGDEAEEEAEADDAPQDPGQLQ